MLRDSSKRPAALAFALFVSGVASERPAHADSSADAAAAQALFDEAKSLIADKRFAPACAKLEESQRLQPAGGTLMFLALCREGEGKTATAWTRFNEALSAARRDGRADRERIARDHIDALTPKLIRLTIVAADAAAAAPGLAVQRDGESVSSALWGTAVPVDPGQHVIRATAPTMKPWEKTISLDTPGQVMTVKVPALEAAPATPIATLNPVPEKPEPAPAPETVDPGGTQRSFAALLGGAGIVGAGVGAVFGLQAMSKKDESDRQCGGSSGPCGPEGVETSRTAATDGNVSTVAFALGGAAIAGAIVLWVTAPRVQIAPAASPGAASLRLSGAF